ncbi:PH domain-containing protein [Arthrobacter sp. zg-ZUI100]|uniref:PH domain-containing protein n=1 Tax=Arthrobacter jiangjiafuii TaxID=2817475 RepID=UPI001AEDB473|nr:PH domain-containing protein [Arthrobacter jiangjiafuii]MBP3035766.1 PH domain-containing protein [Arthrobacter jiangjiafuii]
MPSEAIDPAGISWEHVSPKYLTVRLIGWAVEALVTVALASIVLILKSTGVWASAPGWLAWGLPAVVAVAYLWRGALLPRQIRALCYAERNEDFLLRRGIFFQRTLVVPYGRMQYVDVTVGPLERAFGLCSLKLHTAAPGTNAALPGLPAVEGARLREHLSERGETQLAGL